MSDELDRFTQNRRKALASLVNDVRAALVNVIEKTPAEVHELAKARWSNIAPIEKQLDELNRTTPRPPDHAFKQMELEAELHVNTSMVEFYRTEGPRVDKEVGQAVDLFVESLTTSEKDAIFTTVRTHRAITRSVMQLVSEPSSFKDLGLDELIADLDESSRLYAIAAAYEESDRPYTEAVASLNGKEPPAVSL